MKSLISKEKHQNRVDLLDIMRVMGLIILVMQHYVYGVLPGGGVGIAIFFCLSGYLVTNDLLVKKTSISNFLVRRFFRIYPTYLVICLINFFILYMFDPIIFTKFKSNLIDHLLIIKMPNETVNMAVSILWPLQVELWFYVFIGFIIKKQSGQNRLATIIFLIILSYFLKAFNFLDIYTLPNLSILKMFFWMDNLLYGSLLALILDHNKMDKTKVKLTKRYDLSYSIITFTAFIIIIFICLFHTGLGKYWPINNSIVSFLTAIIVFIGLKHRIYLANKVPKIITTISVFSYVIYLSHSIPVDYNKVIQSYLNIQKLYAEIIAVLTLPLFAIFLHHAVEKPGIKFGKLLLKRNG